ncbi:MAG: hypothetical protein KJ760_19790, partial [Proteobacteria bacterium]|nr:hypothetical protein [Pseudomonadota bacterium]
LAGEVHDTLLFQVKDALSLSASTGSIYTPNSKVSVYGITTNLNNNLVDSTVNVSVYYPNNTLLTSDLAEKIDTGISKLEFTLPISIPEGDYSVIVKANYSENIASEILSFQVRKGDLQIRSSTGTQYNPGDLVKASSSVFLNNGSLASAVVNMTIYSPDGEIFFSNLAEEISAGLFEFNKTLPTDAELGTYIIGIEASYQGDIIHDILVFQVEETLQLLSSTGTFYSPEDEVIIPVWTLNSNGQFVNSSINISASYPNGTKLIEGSPVERELGMYDYNFTLPVDSPTGTYQISIDAYYNNNEAHTVLSFVISSILQEISDTINNINTTVNTINDKVDVINTTVNNIQTTVTTINSIVNTIDSTVTNIQSTVDTINSTVLSINSTLLDVQSVVNNINTTVLDIQTNITTIDSTVNNIQSTVNRIESTIDIINSTVLSINSTVTDIESNVTYINTAVTNINSTVTDINSNIIYINTTVDNINTFVDSINSTVVLINSTVNNIFNADVGKITLDVSTGPSYSPGDSVNILATTTNSSGDLINATVNLYVYYPNASAYYNYSIYNSTTALQSEGRSNYSFLLSTADPLGDYFIYVDANYSGNSVSTGFILQVKSATVAGGGAGGLALNIFNSIGISYAPGDTIRIATTVVNSTGALVNATINVTIHNPSGGFDEGGFSTEQSLGRYIYEFTASSTQGTWRADIDANYSGDE